MITEERMKEIEDEVFQWYLEYEEPFQVVFENTKRDELIRYHDSLGREVRNDFGLWEHKHTPKIVNGIDVSPNHPDAISMKIIESVWERAREYVGK